MRMGWWLVAGTLLAAVGASCEARCVQGKSEACSCTDGRTGAQFCRSDGLFDPCVCHSFPPGDGGGGGSSTGGGLGGFGGTGGGGGGTGGGFFGGGGGTAVPRAPFVGAASPMHIVVGDPLVLQVPHDGGGLPLTWRWDVTGPDGGSVAVDDATRMEPLLTTPAAGNYLVTVTLSSDAGVASASFPVRASPGTMLAWEPTAFAGHRATNRLALASSTPFRVQLHDTVAETSVDVSVGRAPLSLAFTPDGTRLVVGQDAQLQVISLTESPPRVVATWPIVGAPTVLAASNTHAYFVEGSRNAAWVRLATGETGSRYWYYTVGGLTLHPDGDRLYGGNQGVSPDDLIRWDLDPADGGVTATSDSPYHGTYPVCGNAWLSRDGQQAYSACGVVYRLQRTQPGDMVYGGRLPVQRYVSIDESVDGGLLFGLAQQQSGTFDPTWATALVLVVERASLRQNTVAPLPDTSGSADGQFRARFLFVDSNDRLHLFLTGAAGVPSYRTAWLKRTVGDL